MATWKFRRSTEDRDKAVWLYYIWRDRMNLEYVARKSRLEDVYDKLMELQDTISSASREPPRET